MQAGRCPAQFRQARADLTALLADPGFAALELWLRQRRIDPTALRVGIDQFLDKAREAPTQQPPARLSL
jgi:hypothetical protein